MCITHKRILSKENLIGRKMTRFENMRRGHIQNKLYFRNKELYIISIIIIIIIIIIFTLSSYTSQREHTENALDDMFWGTLNSCTCLFIAEKRKSKLFLRFLDYLSYY